MSAIQSRTMVAKNLFTVNRTLNSVKQSSKYASVVIRKHSVWTQDRVIKSPFKDVEIPNYTLYDYVWQNLDKWPERTASVCAVTGRGYTYEQAFKLSNRFAANLRTKFKIQDGDSVAVMLPNVPDYPLVSLGILAAGGVITSINPIYTAHEVQRQIQMSNAKMIVTLPEIVPTIREALKIAKLSIPIVVVKTNDNAAPDGTALFNELSEDIHTDKSVLRQVRRNTNDICFLPYSSGTTGLPKGVELSHRNIIANCEQINDPLISMHNETTSTHQDSVMGVLPFYHIYAATVLMFHKLSIGAKLVTLAKFQSESFLNTIEKQKTNVLFVAPPLILMMASHPAVNEKTFEHVKSVCNGAAPLAASDAERFLRRAKHDIDFRQGYGLTETSPTVTFSPKGLNRYESTGPPVANTELRIVDQDLKNLGPNEVCGHTNRSYTYEQVYRKSRIFAANLRKKFKIKDGDTIAILLPNVPEFPIITFGILAAGGVVTTLNPIYTAYEIERQILLSDTSLIITNEDLVPTVKEALQLAKKEFPIISLNMTQSLPEGTVSYKELVEDNHTDLSVLGDVRRNYDDIAFLPYSSGTTGLPKGVQLTNRNVISNCEQQNTELRQYEYTTESHQDSTLVVLPMFHFYGFGICMLHKMSAGLKLVTLPKFQPDMFLNTLMTRKLQLLYLAPPMVMFLGSYPQVTAKHLELVSTVVSGAAPLPSADINRLFEKAQRDIHFCQGYGMTETSPLLSLTPLGQKTYENVGYALPNIKMKIVDRNTKSLGPGEVGELLVKGPNVMKGYLKNPQANSEVFVDEWLRTGDLAKIDETGLITISDRLKELIKVKGYQVPPAELENVLKEHPAVLDAAVVGVPDSATGERPRGFIVLQPGTKATDKEIIEFVTKRVAPYKKINQITFLDHIPKNPSGKILRKALKEEYC